MSKNNFLDVKPERKKDLKWYTNKKGYVTLEINNVGFYNKILMLFMKKTKTSYIHLDKTGSFIWKNCDGVNTVWQIGELLSDEFGDKITPVYGRLIKYFKETEV